MGHGKLRKFAENETFKCLLQPPIDEVMEKDGTNAPHILNHPIKGHWNERMFSKAQPIVLELGCGRGEYTIDLSQRLPDRNYIGVDIKGARLWQGAKFATERHLPNVAFLRTRIEFIEAFFAPGEISEIWLTFSDPQLKSENKRLTSPLFLERYSKFMAPGGIIHLKTDSRFLYEYTLATAHANNLRILASTTDLYGTGITTHAPEATYSPADPAAPVSTGTPTSTEAPASPEVPASTETPPSTVSPTSTETPASTETSAAQKFPASQDASATPQDIVDATGVFQMDPSTYGALTEVQTYYERMFRQQGYKICYLAIAIDHKSHFVSPANIPNDNPAATPSTFDPDHWRSIEGPRHFLQNP